MEISDQGGDRCGWVVGVEISNPWSWIMGLVGDGDGDGWVFLGLVGVEIGGRGGHFCWRGLGFFGFDQGGDRWSFLYCLVDYDSN